MLQRHEYISQIDKWLGKDLVIVLTGQRRVGKSCLLKLLCQQKAENPKNNISYIDKEKHQFDSIATHSQLNEYIEQHRTAGCVNYILIDEVQEIAEFERQQAEMPEPDMTTEDRLGQVESVSDMAYINSELALAMLEEMEV